VRNVHEAVGKSWRKHMPREVREGQKGLVTLRFKVQNDGTLLEDDTTVVQEFANETLLEKSLSALREAAPFPAFPPSLSKPDATFRFTFSYSLPPNSAGCP
jgi:outer membrane biosynthesis protein TonB